MPSRRQWILFLERGRINTGMRHASLGKSYSYELDQIELMPRLHRSCLEVSLLLPIFLLHPYFSSFSRPKHQLLHSINHHVIDRVVTISIFFIDLNIFTLSHAYIATSTIQSFSTFQHSCTSHSGRFSFAKPFRA